MARTTGRSCGKRKMLSGISFWDRNWEHDVASDTKHLNAVVKGCEERKSGSLYIMSPVYGMRSLNRIRLMR